MLSRRYQDDGRPTLRLNALQLAMKEQVSKKVQEGHYAFESIPCCVCGETDFEELASKDRYGLTMPVVICRVCGLIQTNPRMSQAAYNEFYSSEYRKLYLGTEEPGSAYFAKHYRRGQQIFEYAAKHLPGEPSSLSVLEVGCGTGATLRYFADLGCRVSGVDLDRQCIEQGREQLGLDLYYGTVADLELDHPADLVICSHVVEHLLDPPGEIQAISNRLAPNGLIFVGVPGVKKVAKTHLMDFARYLQNAHTYHFTLTTLTNMMAAAGFVRVCGDERIWSLFQPSQDVGQRGYDNDYGDVMAYLRLMERWQRWLPFKDSLRQVARTILRVYPRVVKWI